MNKVKFKNKNIAKFTEFYNNKINKCNKWTNEFSLNSLIKMYSLYLCIYNKCHIQGVSLFLRKEK